MAAGSPTGSPGSSSLVVRDPDYIKRLKGVIRMLRKVIEENDDGSGIARFGFLMTMFTEELAEEFKDMQMDELTMRLYLFNVGEMISWIGHGDNSRLPPDVREMVEVIQPNEHDDAKSSSHIELDPASR